MTTTIKNGKIITVERNPREPRTLYVGELETFENPPEKYKFDSNDVILFDRTALNVGNNVSFIPNGLYAIDVRLVTRALPEKDFWENYWKGWQDRASERDKPLDLVLIERPRQ